MAYRDTDIGLMLRVKPDQTKKKLLRLFKKHDGNTTYVADDVGVDVATVKRWIIKCGAEFRAEIESYRPEPAESA